MLHVQWVLATLQCSGLPLSSKIISCSIGGSVCVVAVFWCHIEKEKAIDLLLWWWCFDMHPVVSATLPEPAASFNCCDGIVSPQNRYKQSTTSLLGPVALPLMPHQKTKYNWPMANVDSFSVVVAFLMPQFGQSACSIGVSVSMVAAFFNVIHQHCCWPCTLLHCCHVQAALWFGFCHSISPQNNQQHWFQQCFSHCCTLQCFSGEFHWSVDLVPSTSVALQEWYHPEDPKFLHYCIPPKMKNNQSCRALVTRKII